MSDTILDIEKLNTEERLRLIEELWESLSERPEDLPLTDAQRDELDRRLATFEEDREAGIPWRQVLEQIRNQNR